MTELYFSLLAMLIGYLLKSGVTWFREWKQTGGQGALLRGFEDPTKFVFPPREDTELAILPRISIEDFMAINNIISSFINAKREPPSKMLDSVNITHEDKSSNNLILICSSKTNTVTAEALSLIRQNYPSISEHIPEFCVDEISGKTVIRWNHGKYVSNSFHEQNGPLEDVAIILKARNPWAAQYKILIVAGIRGIGTWGAAECLKKWWQPIYNEKGKNKKEGTKKTGSFVALVNIKYDEYDIKEANLIDLKDLDTKAVC